MSASLDSIKVTMIDASFGNDYSLCLCSALHAAGVEVELVAPENRPVNIPAAYPIRRWMPTKDRRSGKIGKAAGYVEYLARVFIHAVKGNSEKRVVHFQFLRRERVECLFLVLLRLFGTRLIFTAHDVLPHENSTIDRVLRSGVYRAARKIIVHSQYMKHKLVQRFRIDQDKVAVIPCGSFDHYIPGESISKAQARASLNLSEMDNVALFFGYIREYKGLDLLLDAFEICRRQNARFRLVVAGAAHPPELEARYRKRIDRISEKGSIVFHAAFVPPEKVAEYFVACDVVILPYKETDHSGIVHLAYSFGRPVITTDVGDMSEIIEDGKSGYILREHSADCLARTILEAFSPDADLAKIGAYVQQLSAAKYSWSGIARQTRDLYLSL